MTLPRRQRSAEPPRRRAQKLVAAEPKEKPEPAPEQKSELEPKLSVVDTERETQKQAQAFREKVQRTFLSWKKQFAEGIGGVDVMEEIVTEESRCFYEEATPSRLRLDALFPSSLDSSGNIVSNDASPFQLPRPAPSERVDAGHGNGPRGKRHAAREGNLPQVSALAEPREVPQASCGKSRPRRPKGRSGSQI